MSYINTSVVDERSYYYYTKDELWLYTCSYGYTATASKHRYQLTIIIVVMCNSNL